MLWVWRTLAQGQMPRQEQGMQPLQKACEAREVLSNICVTEEINRAIKSVARSITKTKLSDKVRSEIVLHKANLKCLNEAVASITATTVWKANKTMNPLGQQLFHKKPNLKSTRSTTSNQISLPVPGYPLLSSNLMARVWNNIPELHSALTLGAAKCISRKWAKSLPR